jgi:hypothetical protein
MKMIRHDNIDCIVTINRRGVDVDGKPLEAKSSTKYKCFFKVSNNTTYSIENVETISRGSVLINGDIISDEIEYYGGTVEIFGKKHDILTIQKHRNAFNPQNVDYTVIEIN